VDEMAPGVWTFDGATIPIYALPIPVKFAMKRPMNLGMNSRRPLYRPIASPCSPVGFTLIRNTASAGEP